MTPTYLLLYNAGGLVVEDGPQAMGVRGSFWVQAEVQGHKNGGEFIPEFFLILQVKKTHGTQSLHKHPHCRNEENLFKTRFANLAVSTDHPNQC